MKKIPIIFISLLAAVVTIPLFSAFEAHIINVTATIENSLKVDIPSIDFGAVFPQEELNQSVRIGLSQSFLNQDRVSEVEYAVKQKPKCGIPIPDTRPQRYSNFVTVEEDVEGNFKCPGESLMLPLLCPYLSKFETTRDPDGNLENDGNGIPSFHGVIENWNFETTSSTQVLGKLSGSTGDIEDIWNIDLHSPCFEGNCDQEWDNFVRSVNPNVVNPSVYIQPRQNEGQFFGCDLWFEVKEITVAPVDNGPPPVLG